MATFELAGFELASGQRPDRTVVSYRTHGTLNAERSNCILFPTPFGATSDELDWIVGANGLFDPDAYQVVVVDTFGNGRSSSPHMLDPAEQPAAPGHRFSVVDNVRAQRLMLEKVLGVRRPALVAGWSMGGQQAYQWGVSYPDAVDRLAVVCGSARTSAHNFVFLEGIRSAVTLALASSDARSPESIDAILRMTGRLYAGWALSQDFYRAELWRHSGFDSLESFLVGYWEAGFTKRHPLNLLAQIDTWQGADVSRNELDAGNLAQALGRISATTLVMPCRQDLYFRVEDSEIEMQHLRRGVLKVIDSPWGHRAGLPVSSVTDRAVLRAALQELLATPTREQATSTSPRSSP